MTKQVAHHAIAETRRRSSDLLAKDRKSRCSEALNAPKKTRKHPLKLQPTFMHLPVLHVAKGLMNADHLVIRMFVDIGQYEARIFVAAGWIESSLRCLCCRLVEVLGPSEPSWYEGIDAQVRHLAVWKVIGGHRKLEAIPEVGTPRISQK